jgi:hypothetical protein
MNGTEEALRGDCRKALEVLDRVLEEPAATMTGDLPEAVRALVRLRNRLIGLLDSAGGAEPVREKLDRANAILSVVTGGEYPMVGVRRERLAHAREALGRLAEDL